MIEPSGATDSITHPMSGFMKSRRISSIAASMSAVNDSSPRLRRNSCAVTIWIIGAPMSLAGRVSVNFGSVSDGSAKCRLAKLYNSRAFSAWPSSPVALAKAANAIAPNISVKT